MVDIAKSIHIDDASPEQLRAALQDLAARNDELEKELAKMTYLKEQIAVLQRALFGRRRESVQNLPDGQTNLFNSHIITHSEQELIDQVSAPKTSAGTPKKRKKVVHQANVDLSKLESQDDDITLPPEKRRCATCGEVMIDIGRTKVRTQAVYIPAKVVRSTTYYHSYICANDCLNSAGKTTIIKAPVPQSVMAHSPASNSVVTESIMQKFAYKVPDYRQVQFWHSHGVDFTRQSLANWHIRAAEQFLKAIYKALHLELLAQDIIHADETPYRVLGIRKADTFFWIYTSGKYADKQIVLYDHGDTRGYDEAARFLKGYHGYLQSDAYSVYGKLPELINVFCWAHVRRKFDEAATVGSQGLAQKGLEYCNAMFSLEKQWRELPAAERYRRRQLKLAPIMDKFFKWLNGLGDSYLPKSKLGTAIQYAQKIETSLRAVLLDGRLELSNNRAERAVKELIMGRKNWLFSQSKRGAVSTGVILSLLATARANHLDPEKYFNYLFAHLPNLPKANDPVTLRDYLPWASKVKEACNE